MVNWSISLARNLVQIMVVHDSAGRSAQAQIPRGSQDAVGSEVPAVCSLIHGPGNAEHSAVAQIQNPCVGP